MLEIMEEFMKQISKQEETQSAEQCYERTKKFGEISTQENLPRKTQNQELPPQESDKSHDKPPKDGAEKEVGAASGQGQPWQGWAWLLLLRVGVRKQPTQEQKAEHQATPADSTTDCVPWTTEEQELYQNKQDKMRERC